MCVWVCLCFFFSLLNIIFCSFVRCFLLLLAFYQRNEISCMNFVFCIIWLYSLQRREALFYRNILLLRNMLIKKKNSHLANAIKYANRGRKRKQQTITLCWKYFKCKYIWKIEMHHRFVNRFFFFAVFFFSVFFVPSSIQLYKWKFIVSFDNAVFTFHIQSLPFKVNVLDWKRS